MYSFFIDKNYLQIKPQKYFCLNNQFHKLVIQLVSQK